MITLELGKYTYNNVKWVIKHSIVTLLKNGWKIYKKRNGVK